MASVPCWCRCNVGYAFINMLRPHYVVPLVERFNNRKWEKFNSEKVRYCLPHGPLLLSCSKAPGWRTCVSSLVKN